MKKHCPWSDDLQNRTRERLKLGSRVKHATVTDTRFGFGTVDGFGLVTDFSEDSITVKTKSGEDLRFSGIDAFLNAGWAID